MQKKKIFIAIIILILLIIYFVYKLIIINEYKTENVEINTKDIFNEEVNINDKIAYDESATIKIDKLTLKNYFTDYQESTGDSNYKIKYDENNQIKSFYAIIESKQYIELLNINSFVMYSSEDQEEIIDTKTEKTEQEFLTKNNILDDIDYLNYLKNNYYLKNNIFTCVKTIKHNFISNTFMQVSLPEFQKIVLIKGRIKGYIVNMKNNNFKEIHLLNDDMQYIITLGGDEITQEEFVINLLKTVEFN